MGGNNSKGTTNNAVVHCENEAKQSSNARNNEANECLASAIKYMHTDYIQMSEADIAIKHCDEAIRLRHNDPNAYSIRYYFHLVKGNVLQAEQDKKMADDLMHADKKDGECASSFALHDEFFRRLGDAKLNSFWRLHREAIINYTMALHLNPNNTHALLQRGIAKCREQEFDAAIADFKAVIEINPGGLMNAYACCGWVYNLLGNYQKALEHYTYCLEVNPGDTLTVVNRAMVYTILNRPQAAIAELESSKIDEFVKASSLLSREQMARDYMACACLEVRRGNHKIAEMYCKMAGVFCNNNVFARMGFRQDLDVTRDIEDVIRAKELHKAIVEGEKDKALKCMQWFDNHPILCAFTLDPSASMINDSTQREYIAFTLIRYGRLSWLDDFLTHEGMRLNVKDSDNNTVLHIAAREGNIEFFNALINKNLFNESKSESNFMPLNNKGENPLHSAAIAGKTEFLMYAYQSEIMSRHFHERTLAGDTILHLLVDHGHTATLLSLLKQLPDLSVQATNPSEQHVLMRAIINKPSQEKDSKLQLELLNFLIKRHIDINAQDAQGLTALHFAVQTNQPEVVKLLLAHGVCMIKDHSGKLPSDYTTPDSPIGLLLASTQKDSPKRRTQWENLVFEGGGVKGLAFASALSTLEEEKVICLEEIKRVGGTSAGAITALLVGLGFSFDEIEHLCDIKTLPGCDLPQIKFTQLLDGPHGATILAAKNKDWSQEEKFFGELTAGFFSGVKTAVKGTVKVIVNAKTLKNDYYPVYKYLKNNLGLCSGDTLYNLADMLIRKQYAAKIGKKIEDIDQPVTFQQLKDAGFKDLYFVGVNTETGCAEYFSYENTPSMLVANAVRISMSIPGVFTPQPKIVKDEHGQLQSSQDLYVDGGVLYNYPVKLFDFETDQYGHFNREGRQKVNKSTLGLRLNPKSLPTKSNRQERPSLSMWAANTMKCLGANYQESDFNGDDFRTVYIDVPSTGVGTLDFEGVEDPLVKQKLTQIGKLGAQAFIGRTSNPSVSIELPYDVEREYQLHLQKVGYKQNGKPKYKLNRNCPKLVLAFYKHAREDLHNYMDKQLGVSLWARDEDGRSVFHMAVIHKELHVLKYLLEKFPNGAQTRTNTGKTPCCLAYESGDEEIIALLKIYTNEQPKCENEDRHEVKYVPAPSSQIFRPATSSAVASSGSGLSYLNLLDDVKQLLEELGKNNFEAYSHYCFILKKYDKSQGDTAEDIVALRQLERELTCILRKENSFSNNA